MDLSRLSPAPWFVGKNRDAHTVRSLVDMEGEEPVGKSDSFTVANCWSGTHATRLKLSVANAEFIALARNAFHIMMRRLWHPVCMNVSLPENNYVGRNKWTVAGIGLIPSEAAWFDDPFTALVEADKWYAANKENHP